MKEKHNTIILPNIGNVPKGHIQIITSWGKETLKTNEKDT
jgi:hypothetical protein